MFEILEWGMRILFFLIDLLTLALIVGIFYVIGLSIVMMARNQSAKWMNIVYILLVMGAGIALLRWYPQAVISSIRVALSEARPEADLLRTELYLWLPTLPDSQIAPAAVDLPVLAPASRLTPSPLPIVVEPTTAPTVAPTVTAASVEALPTATRQPTLAPPLPTATPQPTACLLHYDSVTIPCPPTPQIYGRE